MKKSYIYPFSSRLSGPRLYNPYIDDFINANSKYIRFVNVDKPSSIGIFDITRYIFRIDFIFFNWIEKLPGLSGGKIQTLFLLALIPFFKLLRIKIVWTMHNKLAHTSDNAFWKKLIFRKMLKNSAVILTHSSEGVKFGEEMVKGSSGKIKYLPHPVKDRRLGSQPEKLYDILVWGTISPYKGIDRFLEYIYQHKLENKYNIYIVGKITSHEYRDKLEQFKSSKIHIEDQFINEESLQQLVSQSKLVLYTYSTASILSSGALMDSLGYGANIIGPNVGAFADLATIGIIKTYNEFSELFCVIDELFNQKDKREAEKKMNYPTSSSGLSNKKIHIAPSAGELDPSPPAGGLNQFLKDNSWEMYATNLSKLLNF